jgi:hypothetical protein
MGMPFQPGNKVNLSGRPKGHASFTRRLRDAFAEGLGSHSLISKALDIARNVTGDVEPKDQLRAIEWCASYAFGKPKESLDDGTVQRLAQAMFEQAMSEARTRALAARSTVPAQLVEPALVEPALVEPDPVDSE